MGERRRILLRTVPLLGIGLLFFAVYLVLFVDIPEMIGVIQRTNLTIYALAAIALVVSTLLFSLTWNYLLRPLSVKIPFRRTFLYVWVGVFADLLVPAESVSGEIAKAYLVSKEPNAETGKILAALVSQRILGTFTTTATLFVGFLGLLAIDYAMPPLMVQVLLLSTAVGVTAFLLLILVCVKEQWAAAIATTIVRLADRLTRRRFHLEKFQPKVIKAVKTFHESFRTFSAHPAKLVPAVSFSVLSWLCNLAIAFLVFAAIGYLEPNIPTLLLKVTVVYTLVVAVKSIPLGVPAEVGLPDILMTTLFGVFGIPLQNVSAAATVLIRILTVWVTFFIGFAAIQWIGVKGLIESGVFGEKKNEI